MAKLGESFESFDARRGVFVPTELGAWLYPSHAGSGEEVS
jgi:hypothetical protein